MNLNSFLLEQALKKLNLTEDSIAQLKLVTALGDVRGTGFPAELFELSAPMVVRGLLNFSILQMKRDWVYPFWVHQQLDPANQSFIPRSQNPLLINITHRNWTALGSPHGLHEAIVDPRGLVTPLPREWSVDAWLAEDEEVLFPSLLPEASQEFNPDAPRITTSVEWRSLRLRTDAFVAAIRGGRDVLFCQASATNMASYARRVRLCLSIRPFGVEGVAPIGKIEFPSPRVAFVDGTIGVVVSDTPDFIAGGNSKGGDSARRIGGQQAGSNLHVISCPEGLANAVMGFDLDLRGNTTRSVAYSIALGPRSDLRRVPLKHSWRVSFAKRLKAHERAWESEVRGALALDIGDEKLQKLFDTSRSTLLELHDGEFISPGPYLYHHFWFRDAAPMLRALDVLGFSKRVRSSIDGFHRRQTDEGFYRAPGGEWDSNGAVLWLVLQHYRLSRSNLWLKHLYPSLAKAGKWIVRMLKSRDSAPGSIPGLMPRSLSAEHLGTVDQYYWDSFWSLAGLESVAEVAREVGSTKDALFFTSAAESLRQTLVQSFEDVGQQLGTALIPSTPTRPFDESAIGSIACLYPLDLFDKDNVSAGNTLNALIDRFFDAHGFYHPIIHSGYNAYLSLQAAHALLNAGEIDRAWNIADAVMRLASPTGAFPEAIHPRTGGGAMGDGHHGWAAAEVVLFVRDALVREKGTTLEIFPGVGKRLIRRGQNLIVRNAQSAFGTVDVALEFQTDSTFSVSLRSQLFRSAPLSSITLHLPWFLRKVIPSSPGHLLSREDCKTGTTVHLSPEVSSVLCSIAD